MTEVKVKYVLLNEKTQKKIKTLEVFPGPYRSCDFISQIKEEPQGLFYISEISISEKRITLKQIDCNEMHWKGNNGKSHGPDKDCKEKGCPFLRSCPFSRELMMIVDID